MKLFPVRGGVHPEPRKHLSSERAIERLPLPPLLFVPLQQHIGAPALPVVAAGDRVGKGQLIARSQGAVSAPQHAPTSGRIARIHELAAPHPSGLPQTTIVIEPDGLDEWAELPAPLADPLAGSPQAISERVAQAGIVGLGGAAFPSAVKLGLGRDRKLEILLINGAECEPYLTCDDRLMRERAEEIVDGARLMAHALGVGKLIIAIEANKPQAIAAMSGAAAPFAVPVVTLPAQYPMGSERHLVQAVTGRETPAKKLTADVGVVVHNVATARAVHAAVRLGQPLVSRVVTVSGGAVRQPKNIEAPIGARTADLIAFCAGLSGKPARLISGGPMMGQPLPSLDAPVVKGMSGVLALTADEIDSRPPSPCIRCGSCVSACPVGLVPTELAAFIRHDDVDGAARLGLSDCISCGSCAWVCPSHLPLVQYFNYGKGVLADKAREASRNERTRVLAEARNARLEAAAAAKRTAAKARTDAEVTA
jgi:Na+-translocating ferredoxin:NAD+ oxidoreductase subunit C